MDWVRTMRRCSMCQASAVPESTPVFRSLCASLLSKQLVKKFSATTCLPECCGLAAAANFARMHVYHLMCVRTH